METLIKENEIIKKAHEKYIAFTRDESLVDAYEAHMKWKRDYNSGIALAREEGQKESQIKIAQKMMKNGFNVKMIADMTGISEDEIQQLC